MAINSPVKKPEDENSGAFGAGQSIGRGLSAVKQGVDRAEQVGQGVAAAGVDALTAPIRRAANTAANVGRGIGAATGITPDAQPVPFNPTPMQDAVAKARPEVYGLSRPAATPQPPANVTAAPVAPPVAAPAVNVITPSDPASMALAPPSRAGVSAAGGSGMPMAASAPVPLPANAPSPVVGQFNGRDITRDQANEIAGRMPVAGGPVSAGPNGSFAFSPPGSMASAAAQTAPAPMQTELEVPRFVPPSINTSRVAQAERERAALVKQLDSQISSMATRPNGLNSRGERQLYAQLIAQRTGLTQQVGELAGQAAGQQLGAATTAGVAGMGEAGENARTMTREAGSNRRTQITESGANARSAASLNAPQYQTTASGDVVLTQGASFTPVTGPAGESLKAPTTAAQGQITPEVRLDALVKQLAAEQSALKPDPERLAGLQQQISALTLGEQAAPATGATTAVNPKTGERVRLNPTTGNWEPIQ